MSFTIRGHVHDGAVIDVSSTPPSVGSNPFRAAIERTPETVRSKCAQHYCPECGAWTQYWVSSAGEKVEVLGKDHDRGCTRWKDCE
jgi:hypothetical protein